MTDSDEKQRSLDATMENEGKRDLSPMVQISLRAVSYTHLRAHET